MAENDQTGLFQNRLDRPENACDKHRMTLGPRTYAAVLCAIILVGVAIRLLGLNWLTEAAPYLGYSFHPDDQRFIDAAANFKNPDMAGYPLGMTTPLYVIDQLIAQRLLGVAVDASVVLRIITLIYGALTIWLIAAIARSWQYSRSIALLTAAFMAVAPLHILNSNFGTADVTATFYFFATLWLGWWYARLRRPILLVLFAASLGAAIAVKLFLSLLAPVLVVLWLSKSRFEKALNGALVAAGSFSIFSFFNYTPWNLWDLMKFLTRDNLRIAGGHSPPEHALLYGWETITALGIGIWIFFVIGAVVWLSVQRQAIARIADRSGWQTVFREWLQAPILVFWSGIIAHAALILSPNLHVVRNMLVFVPIFCLIAAIGFAAVVQRLRLPKIGVAAVLTVLFAYQLYNAIGLERLYREDPRNAIAQWIAQIPEAKNEVETFSKYSLVRGARLIDGEASRASHISARYFVTCDLEFARYFRDTDAEKIYHAFGGQRRLNFYRDLFAGRLPFVKRLDLNQAPRSIEQRLIANGVLRDLETFTPRRCVVFEQVEAPKKGGKSGG